MAKDSIKDKINDKLENVEVLSHDEVSPGVHTMELKVDQGRPFNHKELAYLTGKGGKSPLRFYEGGRVISRDFLRRGDLDLLIGDADPTRADPSKIYGIAISYYKSKGFFGTVIDTLTNFASKGFKNDIDDENIKLFYDTWVSEIGFANTVEQVFFDFFRVGMVRTFKIIGKFDPKLRPESFDSVLKRKTSANGFKTTSELKELMAYRDIAAAKKIWSKAYVPLRYTILDPRLIEIKGSLLFDQTETYLKPQAFKELKEMLKNVSKLDKEQRQFVSQLPNELKEAVKKGQPVKLPPELVGRVDYRRQDYERYALPKITRVLDDIRYKDDLKKADFSTLDGITNYILKITIGSDEHPVTSQAQLDAVAELFDTASKSFDIVWNHTLDIEKITFPEIGEVLGQDKFRQVNDDLSQALGVGRSFLDGEVSANSKSIEVTTKAFTEEINYARRSVIRWINSEYESVALAMGFDRYPKVRFDDIALKDEIMLMSVIQGMIDRRILSYETGIEKLGFDFNNELANMRQERDLVLEGYLGVIGSPYNPKALPAQQPAVERDTTPGGKETLVTQQDLEDFRKNMEETLQTIQRTPKGTPSEGRPRTGGRGKKRQKSTTPNVKPRKPKTGIKNNQ